MCTFRRILSGFVMSHFQLRLQRALHKARVNSSFLPYLHMRCSITNGRLAKGSTQIVLEVLSQTSTWVYKSIEVEEVRESVFWEEGLVSQSFLFQDYWGLDILCFHIVWWGEWKRLGVSVMAKQGRGCVGAAVSFPEIRLRVFPQAKKMPHTVCSQGWSSLKSAWRVAYLEERSQAGRNSGIYHWGRIWEGLYKVTISLEISRNPLKQKAQLWSECSYTRKSHVLKL